jgi:nitrogen regulatory protein PII
MLVAVINREECIESVLAGFVELGITGATVMDSRGMGRVLSRDVPIFAGVRTLMERSRPANRTVFCVVDDAKIDDAIAMIQEACGSMADPGAGIIFTLPVSRVVGLSPELDG